MSKRTTIVIVLAAVLVLAGVVVAQVQRARKTAELLDELNTVDTSIALDTARELKKRGHSVESRLVDKLDSDEAIERVRVAKLLGEVGRAKVSGPALLPLLQDESDMVRRAAAKSLGLLAYAPAFSSLLELQGDKEQAMDTRVMAVRAISNIALLAKLDSGDRGLCTQAMAQILERRPKIKPEDIAKIVKARQDLVLRRENAVRAAAGRRIVKPKEEKAKPAPPKPTPPPEAIEEEPTPADNEIELRAEAVLAVGLMAADSAIEPLVHATDEKTEPSPVVRKYACLAIEDLSELPRPDQLRADVGQALLRALDDSSTDVRTSAARALAKHKEIGAAGIDTAINGVLRWMAQDLDEYGEPEYWVRAAARTACQARLIEVPKPKEPVRKASATRPSAKAAETEATGAKAAEAKGTETKAAGKSTQAK
jgi:HEAT repeat protein